MSSLKRYLGERRRLEMLSIEDYKYALKEVAEIVRDTAIGSLYQYGSVNHPGISDLDLLVVNAVPKDRGVYREFERRLQYITKSTRYIIGHASIITVPEGSAGQICIFDDLDLRHVTGRDVGVKRMADGVNNITYLRLLDWASERLLASSTIGGRLAELDQRFLLCFINSVGYTLEQGRVFGYNGIIESYLDTVRDLRDRGRRGLEVCDTEIDHCIRVGYRALSEILDFLSVHKMSGIAEEQVGRDVECITVEIRGRGRIVYERGAIMDIGDGDIRLPLGMGLNWYSLSRGTEELAEYLTVLRNDRKGTVTNVVSGSDLMRIADQRGKVGREWLEYKRIHDGTPRILKYNFFD